MLAELKHGPAAEMITKEQLAKIFAAERDAMHEHLDDVALMSRRNGRADDITDVEMDLENGYAYRLLEKWGLRRELDFSSDCPGRRMLEGFGVPEPHIANVAANFHAERKMLNSRTFEAALRRMMGELDIPDTALNRERSIIAYLGGRADALLDAEDRYPLADRTKSALTGGRPPKPTITSTENPSPVAAGCEQGILAGGLADEGSVDCLHADTVPSMDSSVTGLRGTDGIEDEMPAPEPDGEAQIPDEVEEGRGSKLLPVHAFDDAYEELRRNKGDEWTKETANDARALVRIFTGILAEHQIEHSGQITQYHLGRLRQHFNEIPTRYGQSARQRAMSTAELRLEALRMQEDAEKYGKKPPKIGLGAATVRKHLGNLDQFLKHLRGHGYSRVSIVFKDISERKRVEQVLRESEERQTFLLMLSDRLRTEVDAHAIVVTSLGLLADHMRLDRAYVAQVDKGRDLAEIGPEYRRPDLAPVEGVLTLSDFPEAFAQVEATTLVLADTAADPTLSDLDRRGFAELRMGALMVASARKGTRNPVWSLLVASEEPRRWTAGEVALVEETAERTWAAIERARAEATLRESETRLRTLVTSLPGGAAFIVDNDLRYLLAEGEALTDAGFRPEDLVGRTIFEALPAELARDYEPHYRGALAGEPFELEHRAHGRTFVTRGAPLPFQNGKGRTALVVSYDITDRKLAEEALRESEMRFRQFGEASSDVLWIRSAETLEWEYLSDAFKDIYGENREKALTGDSLRRWAEMILPEDRKHALANIRRVFEGERVTFEYRIRRPSDGQVRWLRNTDFPLLDNAGGVQRIGGIGHDATEEKEFSDRLQVLVAELQHRTRNLIAVVRSLSDKTLKESSSLDDFQARYNDRLKAVSRVQGLLSRLREGQKITFDELLRTELSALGALDGHADRVTLDGPDGIRLRSGTVQTFALALHELATNAVKYGALSFPDGHLTVRWHVEMNGAERRLHVEWRESGVAMPDAEAAAKGSGYGRELIERALPYQLKAETSYKMGPDGVRCTILVPISEALSGERHDV